jgi:two-component sensor histidine kinase/streptogramin lyase
MKRKQQIRIATYHIICVLWFLCNTSEAQKLNIKIYSSEDGLSNTVVRNITQDKFGHVWIGTENGLNKFDGHQFTTYLNSSIDQKSISNNFIFGLDTDQQGVIWIGTDHGLNAFDPATEIFTAFKNTDDSTSISDDHIRCVFVDDDNNVWVGTENGLNVFNRSDSTFKRLTDSREFDDLNDRKDLSFNRINSINQAKDGKIWIGSDGGGVKIYDDTDDHFLPLTLPKADNDRLFKIVRTIFFDTDNTVWFGCDGGLVKLNTNGDFTTYERSKVKGELNYGYIWSIVQRSENELWLGSYGGGLISFDIEKERFYQLKSNQRNSTYEDNLVWTLFKDRSEDIWIGFDGNGGVGYINESETKFQHLLDKTPSKKHNVQSVIEIAKDSLIVGTSDETFLLLHDTLQVSLQHLQGKYKIHSKPIKLADGYLFFSYNKFIITNKDFTVRSVIPQKNISAITCGTQDAKGIIWIGTLSNGVIKINPVTKEIKRFFTEGHLNIYHDSRSISSLYLQGDTTLWVGRVRYGLTAFNTLNEQAEHYLYNDGKYTDPTINSIAPVNETQLVLGTNESGIIHFNTDTKLATSLHYLTSTQIQEILIDDKSNYWISTVNGLHMLNVQEDSLIHFGLDDGLQSMIFNSASTTGENRVFYFGGDNGINKFIPKDIKLFKTNLPVHIDRISVNNEPISWSLNQPIYTMKNISLSHIENDISISFTSNSYLHTDSYQFEYAINDEVWKSLGNQRNLILSNLSPGNYSIAIRSLNHDNFASEPYTLAIEIKPPWYNTLLFRVIFVLAIIVIGFVIYRWRVKSIKKQNKYLEEQVDQRTKELKLSKAQAENDKLIIEKSLIERESLLKEIHHRVKNNLQIIASLLYLQSGKFEDEDFKKVLEEGQGRVRSMALIHQKLYENEDLKSIPFGEYLNELVSEIRASFGMPNIQLNIKADDIHFDVDTAVPLGLIVNEMATNAFKYAFEKEEKGSISIFLTQNNGEYIMNIKDDGKGIPNEIDIRKTKSLGLRLVRMLSQQLEGDFEFKSDNGTSFELKFAA